MTNSGIYVFLNLINGKFYLGSTKNFYKRFHSHVSLLKNNKHDNSYFQRAWNKYGKINFIFVILEYVEDANKLEEVEQSWLDKTKCYERDVGYNRKRMADNSTGVKHTEETKIKLSILKTGIKHTDEARLKMSKHSHTRNEIKWPCPDKAKCQCEWCKGTRRIRNREHSRELRAANKEKYNEYMRNYNAKRKDANRISN